MHPRESIRSHQTPKIIFQWRLRHISIDLNETRPGTSIMPTKWTEYTQKRD